MMRAFTLRDFLLESNRIEGISGVKPSFLAASEAFLAQPRLEVADLVAFVKVAQPNAVLRDKSWLNVRVGPHVPPQGGPEIVDSLKSLLIFVNDDPFPDPYRRHVQYETLHPFTDGNGRSGRILWLWMMGGIEHAPLGFLHHWYYQSLQNSRAAPADPARMGGKDG